MSTLVQYMNWTRHNTQQTLSGSTSKDPLYASFVHETFVLAWQPPATDRMLGSLL